MLALAFLLTAAPIAFDIDAVGLSPLERSAVEERSRIELSQSGALVEAKGLVACREEPACLRLVLVSASAVAGASLRVVKVLQVVRIELLVVSAQGAVIGRSSRTLDLEQAARGPLFEKSAIEPLLAFAEPPTATQAMPPAFVAPDATGRSLAIGGVILGGLVGIGAASVAANEAVLANSAASAGEEKERARGRGPIASIVAASALVLAVASGVAWVFLAAAPASSGD